jgi:hypothetical protein
MVSINRYCQKEKEWTEIDIAEVLHCAACPGDSHHSSSGRCSRLAASPEVEIRTGVCAVLMYES